MDRQTNITDFQDGTRSDGGNAASGQYSDQYKNPEWLRKQYVKNRRTMEDIGNVCDVSAGTIQYWLDKYDIETREPPTSNTSAPDELQDPDWLREQYVENERSMDDIGDEFGLSGSSVHYWLEKHSIETRQSTKSDVNVPDELQDPDWLREQYVENERSTVEIAEEFDVTAAAVSYRLRKFDIETRSISDANISVPDELQDPDWLRDQYWNKGHNTIDIGEKLDVPQQTVWKWMEKHGLERRSLGPISEGDTAQLKDSEWLREQYWKYGRSTIDIAEELGVSDNAVARWMEKHGIERRSLSEAFSDADKSDLDKLQDPDWLREQYIENERSSNDIAEEIGVSGSTVLKRMEELGISSRSTTEAQKKADHNLADERLTNPEWLKEQYYDKKYSIPKIAEIVGAASTTVGRWFKKHGIKRRPRLDAQAIALAKGEYDTEHLDHYVRSAWELEIANMLNESGINYQYESISIKYNNGRTYTPDFVTDEYVIEVKGRIFDKGNDEKKARIATQRLDNREYVVVGTKLPADYHIDWDNRGDLIELLED